MIFALEQQKNQLSCQVETLGALVQQNELISKLKLRERGLLLIELSEQVKSLRCTVKELSSCRRQPTATSQSTTALPRIDAVYDSPESSPARFSARELGTNTQSMPCLDVRPATVGSRGQIPAVRSSSHGRTKAKDESPLHNKPFIAPLYNVKDRVDYNEFVSDIPQLVSSPKLQTNFLLTGGKRANMLTSPADALGREPTVDHTNI